MTDTGFGHDGDRHGGLNALDHLGVTHTGDTAIAADVRGDSFKRHDGDRENGFAVLDVALERRRWVGWHFVRLGLLRCGLGLHLVFSPGDRQKLENGVSRLARVARRTARSGPRAGERDGAARHGTPP